MNTIIIPNARVAGFPVFFPAVDPRRNAAIFTVLENDKTRGQIPKTITTRHTVVAWGKLADAACAYCYPGKQIYIEGRTGSFPKQTGQVNPNTQKAVTISEVKVNIRRMVLLGDSMKKLNERVAGNLQALMASGQVPAALAGILTAETLLKSSNAQTLPFDTQRSSITGKHGLAAVWTKDKGFWGPGKAAGAVASAAKPVAGQDFAAMFAQFQANPGAAAEFFQKMATDASKVVTGTEIADPLA